MLAMHGVEFFILAFIAAAAAAASVVYGGGFPKSLLTLERAFPASQHVELGVLRARDRSRHAGILQGVVSSVVNFSLLGNSDQFLGGIASLVSCSDPICASIIQAAVLNALLRLPLPKYPNSSILVVSITAAVSQFATPIISKGNRCYRVPISITEIFPSVAFNFAGGASVVLRPVDYLVHDGLVDGAATWCIGFQKTQDQAVTILGDLVLKDKIFVYDLAHQRLGWADFELP
ncbi:Aspartic proteinase-like protein 2 [Camellia lanceoleosa]|uniref:Aspartic proteinase-like protein 2 n=1 Tax=Camellia lanceoleosa TaxID=1840588 RepID=A0ACC0G5Y8_9ERIC|nr:Aspartic proteinase-like protein 2 [Camellia lanceoleosa]